jgi:hypothetical protein
MDHRLRQVLLAVDCPDGWEAPECYTTDFNSAWTRIVDIKSRLAAELGIDLDIDEEVQDASFITELYLLVPGARSTHSTVFIYELCIRFSAFGNLFTIFAESGVPDARRFDLVRIRNVVEDKGFFYVEPVELHSPYDGANEAIREDPTGQTWWTRYFDYL